MLKLFSCFAAKSTKYIKLMTKMMIKSVKNLMNIMMNIMINLFLSFFLNHVLSSHSCHLSCQNSKKKLMSFLISFKQIFLIRLSSHFLTVVLCCQKDFEKSKQTSDMSKLQILVILKSIKKLFNLWMQYNDKQSWKIKLTFLWKITSEFWLKNQMCLKIIRFSLKNESIHKNISQSNSKHAEWSKISDRDMKSITLKSTLQLQNSCHIRSFLHWLHTMTWSFINWTLNLSF